MNTSRFTHFNSLCPWELIFKKYCQGPDNFFIPQKLLGIYCEYPVIGQRSHTDKHTILHFINLQVARKMNCIKNRGEEDDEKINQRKNLNNSYY